MGVLEFRLKKYYGKSTEDDPINESSNNKEYTSAYRVIGE